MRLDRASLQGLAPAALGGAGALATLLVGGLSWGPATLSVGLVAAGAMVGLGQARRNAALQRSIDDYVACVEAGVQRLQQATGLAPVVVAHSMGGLALRRWWAEQGANDQRVHHAITIGTPHHGTWLARFAMTPNGRQMQQASRWLQALAAREPATRAARFTCFYSHCDNIVFPPATGTLPGADNRHVVGAAHVHMADRPEPWEELLRRLDRAPPDGH